MLVIAYYVIALLPPLLVLVLATRRTRRAQHIQRWLVRVLARHGPKSVRVLFRPAQQPTRSRPRSAVSSNPVPFRREPGAKCRSLFDCTTCGLAGNYQAVRTMAGWTLKDLPRKRMGMRFILLAPMAGCGRGQGVTQRKPACCSSAAVRRIPRLKGLGAEPLITGRLAAGADAPRRSWIRQCRNSVCASRRWISDRRPMIALLRRMDADNQIEAVNSSPDRF